MKNIADYDKHHYDYRTYWRARKYEDLVERDVLKLLLEGKRFKHFVDIGGSYGRLTDQYYDLSENSYIVDYSLETLVKNREAILKRYPKIKLIAANAYQLPFRTGSMDGTMMVRVLHHIEDTSTFFGEMERILCEEGRFFLEYANKVHLKNQIKALLKLDKSLLSEDPYQQPSRGNNEGAEGEKVPFLNFHPNYIKRKLEEHDIQIEHWIPASFFRSTPLSKVDVRLLLPMERMARYILKPIVQTPSRFLSCVKQSCKKPRYDNDFGDDAVKHPERQEFDRSVCSTDEQRESSTLCCPMCRSGELLVTKALTCSKCGKKYAITSGIYDLRYALP